MGRFYAAVAWLQGVFCMLHVVFCMLACCMVGLPTVCCPADLHSRVFDHHVEHRRAQPDGQEQDEQGGFPEEQPRYLPTQSTHSATSTRTRRAFRPAGINGGADLPADFLSEIYERITTNQIRARPLPGRNHPSTQRTPRQPQVRCTRRGGPLPPAPSASGRRGGAECLPAQCCVL